MLALLLGVHPDPGVPSGDPPVRLLRSPGAEPVRRGEGVGGPRRGLAAEEGELGGGRERGKDGLGRAGEERIGIGKGHPRVSVRVRFLGGRSSPPPPFLSFSLSLAIRDLFGGNEGEGRGMAKAPTEERRGG